MVASGNNKEKDYREQSKTEIVLAIMKNTLFTDYD